MANKNSIFIIKLDKTSNNIDKYFNTFFYTKFRTQENMNRKSRNGALGTTQNIMGLKIFHKLLAVHRSHLSCNTSARGARGEHVERSLQAVLPSGTVSWLVPCNSDRKVLVYRRQ
jgi:hypothetical protein